MMALIDTLYAGKILEAAAGAYTALLGDWFWAFLFMTGMILVQIKTRDFTVTSLVGVLVSSVLLPIMPGDVRFMAYILMAGGITIVLYRVFKG